MAMVGEPICLVNRTLSDLEFVADSRTYILKPGDNYGYVSSQAYFAMAQNPLMGSEDYYTLDFQSLVGVKGEHDCSPLSDETVLEAMDKVERFDRTSAGLKAGIQVAPKARMPRGRSGGISNGGSQSAFAVGG